MISPGTIQVAAGSLCRDEFIRFRPVCFCDIPKADLGRHSKIYGHFGLAFRKAFLISKGANPVFYVAKGSLAGHERPPVSPLTEGDLVADAREVLRKHFEALAADEVPLRRCEFFDRLVADLSKALLTPSPPNTPNDAFDPLHELRLRIYFALTRHVFAFMKFFDESLPDEDAENFYMEREWRVADFVEFDLGDVQEVYVAAGFRERIECQFPELKVEELV